MLTYIILLWIIGTVGCIWLLANLVYLFIEENTYEIEPTDWSAIDQMLRHKDVNFDDYDEEMENLRKRLRGV
tara:strand:- start:394 stop:609 length:216 start_codon:yes stop_codon:yes gene_type:complete